MTISFVYDTKKGSTKTIAGWMAEALHEKHTVSLHKPSDLDSLSAELIVVGSPIYFEQPLTTIKGFLELNATILNEKKVAVFIVGWAKRFYTKLEHHIENNYFGPLILPISDAVISRHMFCGWILKRDPEQETEAKEWILGVLNMVHRKGE